MRYRFLDGMRWISAICVVAYHSYQKIYDGNYGAMNGVPNGYLAVDFFFILSGFVIASADERKLASGSMSLGRFVKRRLIRLMPLVPVGVLVGAILLVMKMVFIDKNTTGMEPFLFSVGMNLFLIPFWSTSSDSSEQAFPADGVLWSLFFELVVNVFWSIFFPRATNLRLFAMMALSGLGVIISASYLQTMNFGPDHGTLIFGVFRSAYGFFVGVLLYRFRHIIGYSSILPFVGVGILLVVLFVPLTATAWTVPASMMLLPVAVLFGSAAQDKELLPAAEFLGQLSYPLYIIHLPLIRVISATRLRVGLSEPVAMIVAMCAASVAAFILMRVYEEPMLAWLKKRVLGQSRPATRPVEPGAVTLSRS